MILKGEFRPGERISELPLAARLKISRTPLRLALDRLSHEGLLECWPTGGFVLRGFTIPDIWDAIETRGVLEGTAARLAAERLSSAEELDVLRECCDRLEQMVPVTADTFGRYLEWNTRFHSELVRLCKSPILAEALERICALPFAAPGALVFGDAESAQSPTAAAIAHEHHRAILDAIEHREGTRAEAVAREHSRVSRKNLARALADRQLLSSLRGASLIQMPVDARKAKGGRKRKSS